MSLEILDSLPRLNFDFQAALMDEDKALRKKDLREFFTKYSPNAKPKFRSS